MSKIHSELSISKEAFGGMHNLQFLEIYKKRNGRSRLNLPQGLNYLTHKLRLLHWDSFPMRSLPSKFSPDFLVELRMTSSKLEKLWQGIIVSSPETLLKYIYIYIFFSHNTLN